jgi:hypothetical protein
MWSNDPTQNLLIAQGQRDSLVGQKICATADGGFYISWLDEVRGYSLFLQRLDVSGNLLLPIGAPSTDGILVYERALTSGPRDYSLTVDAAGNAVLSIDAGLALEGSVDAGGAAVACKVSPDGELMFGAAGITLSQKNELVQQVFCASTSDGGAVFGWSLADGSAVHMVKLDANGNALWGDGKLYLPPRPTVRLTDIQAADAGSAIYSFAYNLPRLGINAVSTGFFTSKLNSEGLNKWIQDPCSLFLQESESGISSGDAPKFVSDGQGGAVYCYRGNGDPRVADPTKHVCFVQRVDAAGLPQYEGNGAIVSIETPDSDRPCFGFDAATDRIYVLWLSGESSIRAQCIDRSGQRLWGDQGIALVATTPGASPIPVAITPIGENVMASWIQYPAPGSDVYQPIRVALLDGAGTYLWPSQTVDIKTSTTTTDADASAVLGAAGYEAFVWGDDDNRSVRAQNINQDGSLGVAPSRTR